MANRNNRAMWLTAVALTGMAFGALGQQPVKGPTFPPINPAVARLDQTIGGLDGPGYAIAYSEDMDLLVAACDAGSMQGWKKDVLLGIRNGTGSANKLRGHQGPVVCLAWNGGKTLASAGADRKILLWSPLEGVVSKTITSDGPLNALAMDPEGKLLAGAGEDLFVHLWDLETAKPKGKLAEHTEWILALAFSPDGKQLASGDFGGKVLLWDVADDKKIRELTPRPMPPPKVPPDPVRATALAFAPDGKSIAIGGGDGVVHLVSVGDGKLIRSMPGPHQRRHRPGLSSGRCPARLLQQGPHASASGTRKTAPPSRRSKATKPGSKASCSSTAARDWPPSAPIRRSGCGT